MPQLPSEASGRVRPADATPPLEDVEYEAGHGGDVVMRDAADAVARGESDAPAHTSAGAAALLNGGVFAAPPPSAAAGASLSVPQRVVMLLDNDVDDEVTVLEGSSAAARSDAARMRDDSAGVAATSGGGSSAKRTAVDVEQLVVHTEQQSANPLAQSLLSRFPPALRGGKVAEADQRVRLVDPYDEGAWNALFLSARNVPNDDLDPLRDVYEGYLWVFPTSGKHWKSYIDFELKADNIANVKRLFKRSILQCLDISLWLSYLQFVQKHQKRGLDVESQQREVLKACELALEHVGNDVTASPVWLFYIDFVMHMQTPTPGSRSERQYLLRNVFDRALNMPMFDLQEVWKRYEDFAHENNVAPEELRNKEATFRKTLVFFQQRSDKYKKIARGLLAKPTKGDKELEQADQWRQVIAYELRNVQKLDTEALKMRVTHTYNLALMYMYHYPEFWFDFHLYLNQWDSESSAAAVLQRAAVPCGGHVMLGLLQAEFEERCGRPHKAKEAFERLVRLNPQPIVFIEYQKFALRTEGQRAARVVFVRARKSPTCTHHVYLAAGRLEYHINRNEDIAKKIFEMGMKVFYAEPSYVLAYADFLMSLNDLDNARAVLERGLRDVPADNAVDIWKRFLHFESMCGDFRSIARVEARMRAELPEFDRHPIVVAQERYSFMDLEPISSVEAHAFALMTRDDRRRRTRERVPASSAAGAAGAAAGAGAGKAGAEFSDDALVLPGRLKHFVDMLPPTSAFGSMVLDDVDIGRLIKSIEELPVPDYIMAALTPDDMRLETVGERAGRLAKEEQKLLQQRMIAQKQRAAQSANAEDVFKKRQRERQKRAAV